MTPAVTARLAEIRSRLPYLVTEDDVSALLALVECYGKALPDIDAALICGAAEYVPCILDVFTLIDKVQAEAEKIVGGEG